MDLAGQTIGGYRLEEELGRGAMGTVFRATDAAGRAVAVKLLERAEGTTLERFKREGELLAKVGTHPHVVAVHAAGADDGRPFLVMELVDGGSLEERLPLSVLEAARVVEEVAQALEHLHRHGLVHRDVKPGNVLLGSDGRARLTDFGLARDLARETRLTGHGQAVGTPYYMAPETLGASTTGEPPGPLADVYALGALLFAALVGRPPHDARTFVELVHQVTEGPVPRPSEERADVPRELDAVVERAMAKAPAERYASAADLGRDLARFRRGEALEVGGVSGLARLVRLARRNPRAALLVIGASVVTLALPFVALALGASFDEWRSRKEAERRAARWALAVEGALVRARSERGAAEGELGARSDLERVREHAKASLSVLEALPPAPPETRAGLEGVRALEAVRAENALAHRLLGDAFRAQGDDARALAEYRRAASGEVPVELACRLAETAAARGEVAAAQSALDALAPSLRARPDVQRARGLVLLARGDAAEAERALEPLAKAATDPLGVVGLARARLELGQVQRALEALDRLDRLGSLSTSARRTRAAALVALEREAEAHDELERASRAAPADRELALERARFLLVRGEGARAASVVEPFASDSPAETLFVLAASELLEGDAESALARLSKAKLAPAVRLRAALEWAGGDLDGALTHMIQAVELSAPGSPRARSELELGRLALARAAAKGRPRPEDLARAEDAFEKARVEPTARCEATAGLARVALARGDLARARELARTLEGESAPAALAARVAVGLAARDESLVGSARGRLRAQRTQSEGDPAPVEGGLAPDEVGELAAPLESAALGTLARALKTGDRRLAQAGVLEAGLALALRPGPRREVLLARACLLLDRTHDACTLARAAAETDPGEPGAAWVLARTSLASGEDLEGALAALDVFARTETLGPGDGIATRVLRARLLVRLGRLGPARDELETAVLVQPHDASLALALASLARELHDPALEARELARVASVRRELEALIPKYQEAVAYHAYSPGSRELLNRRIELDPGFSPGYQYRAAFEMGSDWGVGPAVLDFARYLALDGSEAHEVVDWTRTMGTSPLLDPEKMRHAVEAAGEATDAATRLYAAGLAEILADQTGIGRAHLLPALRALERVEALAPESHAVLVLRGRLRQRLGRRESARADLEASLQLGEAPLLAHYYLAGLCARENDVASALEHLERCREGMWDSLVERAGADPDLEPLHQDARYKAWAQHTRRPR